MFDATVSAVANALVGAFAGALLSRIGQPILDIMRASPYADMESAATIIAYLEVAVGNFLRAALLGALMVLLARAIIESEVLSA